LASRVQREDGEGEAGGAGGEAKMTEKTVPVPAEHKEKVDKATGGGEAAKAAPTGEGKKGEPKAEEKPPPVPDEAKVKAPVDFKFELLPPELQIKFLEDFKFTATVTAARLAWHKSRYGLGLGYEYGGPLSLTGSVGTGAGKFSGSAAFDPGAMSGTFGLGWSYKRWNASLGATTGGKFSGGLKYGAALPPMYTDLSSSMYGGEAGMRGLMGAVPGVLSDPATLPGAIGAHGEDIGAVGKAAKDIGKVADLTKRDPKKIDWGFYFRITGGPGYGLGATAGAGLMFKRDPDAPPPQKRHQILISEVLGLEDKER